MDVELGPTLMVPALFPGPRRRGLSPRRTQPADAVGDAPERHGIAMHGEPALPPGFAHLPYANPQAPKGGRIAIGLHGTFDSLNPLVVIGVAPDAVPRYVQQSLLAALLDEPFTGYGLLARVRRDAGGPQLRRSSASTRGRASRTASRSRRRTCASPSSSCGEHGKPFHRSSLGQVKAVETPDELTIRFDLSGSDDRELPLIIGRLPIFAGARHGPEPIRADDAHSRRSAPGPTG